MSEQSTLEKMRPWLLSVARKYSRDPSTQQDLAQEGWIAMWRALQKESTGENVPAYLKSAALNRMTSVVRDQMSFGQERRTAGSVITSIPIDSGDSVWQFAEPIEDLLVDVYFEGRIQDAVEMLAPRQREYVKLRFWEATPWKELQTEFGGNGIWSKAKKNLKRELLDLVEPTEGEPNE